MFIILGIVILVISFIVALISLIREQSKGDMGFDAPSARKKEPPIAQASRHKDPIDIQSASVGSNSAHATAVADMPVGRPHEQVVQEPLSAKATEGKNESVFPSDDTNQKTIEQIKAELAKIAIEKGSAKPRQGATEPTLSQSPIGPSMPLPEAKPWPNDDVRVISAQVDSNATKNLTGEISLRNIPRRD